MRYKLLSIIIISFVFLASLFLLNTNRKNDSVREGASLKKTKKELKENKKINNTIAAVNSQKEELSGIEVNLNHKKDLKKSNTKVKKEEFDEEENKFDEPDKFVQYEVGIRTKPGQTKPDYPKNYKIVELNKAVEKRFGVNLQKYNSSFKEVQGTPLPWNERGPGNVSGRTRGLIVDPDDASGNTWFAGSVSGGIWKTTDAGITWTDKTPALPNIATTVLAMASSNHDIIYAGTGEGFYNVDAINGDGIFRSTDHGNSWNQLASTANNYDFQNVNRIIVDPSNANNVFACANIGFYYSGSSSSSGVFHSTDGGTNWNKVYSSSARVQQMVANPENFNTLFATVNGLGVIKSLDRGLTWNTTTGIITSGRVEIAVAPTDTSRMYAAVESSTGSDLFMSTDAGSTWTLVNDVSGNNPNWLNGQGWYDNTIVVSPYSEDTLFVGGVNIYKISMAPGTDTVKTFSASTTNTSSFLGYINWGGSLLYGSTGTGTEFHGAPINLSPDDYISVEIRFGPGMTQKAHRFLYGPSWGYTYQDYVTVPFQVWDITNNRQLMVSFRDFANDGQFDLAPYDPNNIPREYIFVNAVPYDASNPDPNIAQTGGMRYKNIYAGWYVLADGATWDPNNLPVSKISINYSKIIAKLRNSKQVTNWYAGAGYPYSHADHHNLITIPVDQATNSFRILDANDGGASISNDGGVNWTQITTYQTTQFYGADKNPVADQFIGGMQDNGTWFSDLNPGADSAYHQALSGDGYEVDWKYDDQNMILGSLYYNRIYKSTDRGLNWNAASNGLTDANNSGRSPFMTKIAKTNLDPDLVFATSMSGVWRSDNFADSWTLTPVSGHYNGSFSQIKISQANPQMVWAGTYMNSTYGIFVSGDGGLSFNKANNYTDVTMGRISGLATHPTQDSTAYVLFSYSQAPKILRTTDLGQTWTDISGFGTGTSSTNGFPDVAVYCLLVMPNHPDTIWVGTEIGLFQSTDNGANWALAGNGIPNVAIWEMKLVGDQVVVATHGRGIWSAALPWLSGYTLPSVTKSPRVNPLGQDPNGNLLVPIALRSSYDSTHIFINGNHANKIEANAAAKDSVIKIPIIADGTDTVYAISYMNGHQYKSSTQIKQVKALMAAQVTYINNFNSASNDFYGSGFSLSTVTGFMSDAIHSPHPYSNNTNNTYMLLVPITVASEKATFSYDDVAIVEPGDPGSVYGDDNFWDYVIVEGSADGTNWIPISGAYDARLDANWLSAFNSSGTGDSLMFVHHSFNLLDNFTAGQNILIRFRLYTDGAATGWGWAIDNLSIQENAVPVELTSFTANSIENSVNLVWQTATEKNNSGFEIQRSKDKITFSKIGYVNGFGSSTEKHSYSFVDEKAISGKSYYRLKQIDFDGSFSYSPVVEVVSVLPNEFKLAQNYPNPFNPTTTIKYQLPAAGRVVLTIYNSLGERVKTLVDEIKDAGYYQIVWNGRNEVNTNVATGIYIYRIQSGKFMDIKKMILIK